MFTGSNKVSLKKSFNFEKSFTRVQWYDANISLPGCDKNMPGTLMAMGRLNRPAFMIYGGTIKPGYSAIDNSTLDIVSAFQSYGAFSKDRKSVV